MHRGREVIVMGIADFVVLAAVAFCLALAGVFMGYRKGSGDGCSGSCSSCSMDCGGEVSKDKKKQVEK